MLAYVDPVFCENVNKIFLFSDFIMFENFSCLRNGFIKNAFINFQFHILDIFLYFLVSDV